MRINKKLFKVRRTPLAVRIPSILLPNQGVWTRRFWLVTALSLILGEAIAYGHVNNWYLGDFWLINAYAAELVLLILVLCFGIATQEGNNYRRDWE